MCGNCGLAPNGVAATATHRRGRRTNARHGNGATPPRPAHNGLSPQRHHPVRDLHAKGSNHDERLSCLAVAIQVEAQQALAVRTRSASDGHRLARCDDGVFLLALETPVALALLVIASRS